MAMKILIAEDDEDILAFYVSILEKQNHEITTAISGRKAFDLTQEQKFDLIISDFRMPGMSGVELISRIKARKLNQDTPFVILSGALDDEACNRFQYLNVADIIAKPVDPETISQLPQKHRKLAGSKHQLDELDPTIVRAFSSSLELVLKAFDAENTQIGEAKRLTSASKTDYTSAIIGIFGRKMQGSLALNLSEDLMRHIIEKTFLGMPIEDLSKHRDLVSELANQILGEAKRRLADLDLYISIGIPISLQGTGTEIHHLVSGILTQIEFTSEGHTGFVEVCLAKPSYENPQKSDSESPLFRKISPEEKKPA